jgi:integrase
MAAIVLTARFVETAKPKRNRAGAAVRTEFPDAACPGLHLIVQPTGTRSWAFRFHHRGATGKKTLGSAGDGGLSLAAARAAAATHRHRLEQGLAHHSAGVTAVTPVTGVQRGGRGDAIETAIAAFLELHVRRKNRASTAQGTEGVFNSIVLPVWRGRTIDSIRKRDVIELVESIAADGRGYRANRTLAALSKFFNWLVARDALAFSPVAGVEPPHKEEERTRVLSDDELRAVWLACEDEGPSGQALRLLILTGTRRSEAGELPWPEIDKAEQMWRLPADRAKNGQACNIPLSSQAWALIQAQPLIAGCPYVFTSNGTTAVNNWDKVKHRVSARARIAADDWRLHDLRRTAASGMQKLGIQVPVIERALNHTSGSFRGIVGRYQQHDYADEIRIALQRWADRVEEIVGGKPGKVVQLRGSRQ